MFYFMIGLMVLLLLCIAIGVLAGRNERQLPPSVDHEQLLAYEDFVLRIAADDVGDPQMSSWRRRLDIPGSL